MSLQESLISEVESSSIFVMLRSTPPGTAPIKMKIEYVAVFIFFLLSALFILNGVFYYLQGRYIGYIPSPSELSIGSYQVHLTSTFYPICGFILSILLTIRTSHIDLSSRVSKLTNRLLRFFSIFNAILFIFYGCFTIVDHRFVHNITLLLLTICILVYECISARLVKTWKNYLSISGSIAMFALSLTLNIVTMLRPYKIQNIVPYCEYAAIALIFLFILSLFYELSQVILDVVVIQEKNNN